MNGLDALPYKNELLSDAKKALENQSSSVTTYNGYTAFVECVKPLISLIIIGAGNDAIPLTKIAGVLGWNITVIDGRPNYASPERFHSEINVMVAKPHQVLNNIEVNEWTAIVLMTHNYNYEIALLHELLPLKIPYIGILGPKKKLDRMLGELEDNGVNISAENLMAIHGPVGLDIGSENAEEIALAITAEIKAEFSARNAQPLNIRKNLYIAKQYDRTDHTCCRSSSRLGQPKQNLLFKGKTLLENAVESGLNSKCNPIIVVLGANSNQIKPIPGITILYNEDWINGMTSSIRKGMLGMSSNPKINKVIIMLCDQPFVDSVLLDDLINKQIENG